MNFLCDDPCIVPNAEANPFNNFSSEKPDAVIFTGNNTGGGGPPPLGPWLSTGCIGLCVSSVSQEAADICAFNQKVICDSNNWPVDFCTQFPNDEHCTLPPGDQPPPPPVARPTFGNDEQSCTVNCPDGTPFTVVVAAGTFIQFSRAQANAIAASYACNQAMLKRICLSAISPAVCCTNQSYSSGITISGSSGAAPFTFVVESGFLPIGLSLHQVGPSSAIISGIPTVFGDFTFVIRASNGTVSIVRQYTVSVVGIVTSSFPNGSTGTPYSSTLSSQGPVVSPVWSVASGTLPDGLTLNTETGEISGTPTTDQVSSFTISMATLGVICSHAFTIEISASGCPDWTQLLWDAAGLATLGGGTASFTPSSIISDTFSTATSAPDGGNLDFGQSQNQANLSYTGGPCNCNVHLILAKGLSTASVGGGIIITLDGNLIIVIATGGSPDGTMPSGTYDIPFVLPDTGGIPANILISVTSQCITGGFPDDTPSISMIATFSNLP